MKKLSAGDIAFNVLNYGFMVLLSIACLYPFLNVIALSLNDSIDTVRGGIGIWPRVPTIGNYRYLFSYPFIQTAVINSALRTLISTILGVFLGSMLAFTLSRKDFFARKFISLLFIIVMYVSAGLIPDYMNIRRLGLLNTFAVYILPGLISTYNVIVIRSYMDGLPFELQESATLDGANDFVIFLRIILPLCMPVLATISLFIAVGAWNAWFDTYIYASTNKSLTTLQFELQKILTNTQSQMSAAQEELLDLNKTANTVSPESIRMAMTVIATLPILLVYPFVQKYFMKGMVLGAVKD